MNVKGLMNSVGRHVKDNAPTILGTVAMGSGVAATVMAVKATFKASEIIEEYGREQGHKSLRESLSVVDYKTQLKLTYNEYIPVAVLTTVSLGAVVAALVIQTKRYDALASLLVVTRNSYYRYQEKVVDLLGEKADTKVSDAIRADILKEYPVTSQNVISTGHGKYLCYDLMSGRYFESDIESIRSAINTANQTMIGGANFITLNEVYSLLGLEGIDLGRDIGWNVDKLIELNMGSHLASDGRPCLVVGYDIPPHSDYY